jgi:hypothetical protein|tara:strand:+ start:6491 stop:6655 length:165 start_codon:yes stop_codon:yes gene_type:complete
MAAITRKATKIIKTRPASEAGQLDLVIEDIWDSYPTSHRSLAKTIIQSNQVTFN